MPRKAKPARLLLRPARRRTDGRLESARWVILDRGKEISTGCGESDTVGAEQAFERYLGSRHEIPKGKRDPSEIPIADVLNLYIRARGNLVANTAEFKRRAAQLLDFFGERMLEEVNGELCREYAEKRGSGQAARRELEDLRAAINHHRSEGHCSAVVGVALPPKSPRRERWLTKSEAAAIVWAAWRHREVQLGGRTKRHTLRHIARFLVISLRTGTRSGAVCNAALERMEGRGFIDTENGVFHRRAEGARETKKRQPPIRLPDRLLHSARRWKAAGQTYAVEWNGAPVDDIHKGFARAVELAGLDPSEVTPHVLRHTAITWAMQGGADKWEASGYFGVSLQLLEEVYGHHHPDHQRTVLRAIGGASPMKSPRNTGTDNDSVVGFVREIARKRSVG
jgi:integrase